MLKCKIFLISKYPYSNAMDYQLQKIRSCETEAQLPVSQGKIAVHAL